MVYLLDSNCFIEAKNRFYGFDFCPGFWDWLALANKKGKIKSIKAVKDELEAGNDKLTEWTKKFDSSFFIKPDDDIFQQYAWTQKWAQASAQYTDEAKAKYASNADAWLVATAKAKGYQIVTQEFFNPNIRKEIKIPNAAKAIGVEYTNLFDLLRLSQAKFILAP